MDPIDIYVFLKVQVQPDKLRPSAAFKDDPYMPEIMIAHAAESNLQYMDGVVSVSKCVATRKKLHVRME